MRRLQLFPGFFRESPYVVSYFGGVIKRNHIGRAGVLQERFIEPRHLGRADEMETKLELSDAQIVQRSQKNFSEQPQVDFSRALAIAEIQSFQFQVFSFGLPRIC